MKLNEIAAAKFDVFVQEPYGSGWDPTPVERGEHLVDTDGNGDYEFEGVTPDGKQLIMSKGGKEYKMGRARFDALILPKGTKPIKEGKSDLNKLLAAFKKRQFKSLAVKKNPGDGTLSKVKDAIPGIKTLRVDNNISALEVAELIDKSSGGAILIDMEKLPKDQKVLALLKAMLDGSISYVTVEKKIKADLPHGVVIVSTEDLPPELAHRAVIAEATSAAASTAKSYKLKKYAGAGLGMWIKDAEADGFKVKKVKGDANEDNDVWNAFDGSRKVGEFDGEDRRGWLQAKI